METEDSWHQPLRHIKSDELSSDTVQTHGMSRFEAISGRLTGSAKIWLGRTHVAGGASSAIHHHGESETGIFVVSGHPVFVFADGAKERRIEASPGDFVFVPPFTAHREENPTPDVEAVVVIARSTQEAIVVNLESLQGMIDRPNQVKGCCRKAKGQPSSSRLLPTGEHLRDQQERWPMAQDDIALDIGF